MIALLNTIPIHQRGHVYAIWADGGWSAVVEFCDIWGISDLKE